MQIFEYISGYIIPAVFILIILTALLKKVPVYDSFIDGAKEGLQVVLKIMPTLVGLMIAVGILRSSNALTALADVLAPVVSRLSFPSELVPLVTVKMFSSSAATGLLLDIFSKYGPDSYLGTLASVIMSCTETIFYTMSVYFMTAGVSKTRYTLAGALLATLAGIVVSVLII